MDKRHEFDELINMPLEDYQRYYETIVSELPEHIKEMNMHDCQVIDFKSVDNDLVIYIDNSAGFTLATKVIFKNCNVVKLECDLIKAWWLDNWVFILEDRYLFGTTVELVDRTEYIDFYVKATDVQFV